MFDKLTPPLSNITIQSLFARFVPSFQMLSSSRHAYQKLNALSEDDNDSSHLDAPQYDEKTPWHDTVKSQFRTYAEAIKFFATDNVGLLLIFSSQIFYASMNVSVKKLNSLPGEPVSTLEVWSI